jgi:hypothetical protein
MKTTQRELQVAFSPRVQPWWFRFIKWSVLIAVTARYRKRRWFPYVSTAALMGGLSLHLFYRWKTQGWTRPALLHQLARQRLGDRSLLPVLHTWLQCLAQQTVHWIRHEEEYVLRRIVVRV